MMGSFAHRDAVATGRPGSWGSCPIFDAVDEAVLDGEQGRPGTVGDAGLEVDVLEVVAHRLGTDRELPGDLGAGAARATRPSTSISLLVSPAGPEKRRLPR